MRRAATQQRRAAPRSGRACLHAAHRQVARVRGRGAAGRRDAAAGLPGLGRQQRAQQRPAAAAAARREDACRLCPRRALISSSPSLSAPSPPPAAIMPLPRADARYVCPAQRREPPPSPAAAHPNQFALQTKGTGPAPRARGQTGETAAKSRVSCRTAVTGARAVCSRPTRGPPPHRRGGTRTTRSPHASTPSKHSPADPGPGVTPHTVRRARAPHPFPPSMPATTGAGAKREAALSAGPTRARPYAPWRVLLASRGRCPAQRHSAPLRVGRRGARAFSRGTRHHLPTSAHVSIHGRRAAGAAEDSSAPQTAHGRQPLMLRARPAQQRPNPRARRPPPSPPETKPKPQVSDGACQPAVRLAASDAMTPKRRLRAYPPPRGAAPRRPGPASPRRCALASGPRPRRSAGWLGAHGTRGVCVGGGGAPAVLQPRPSTAPGDEEA